MEAALMAASVCPIDSVTRLCALIRAEYREMPGLALTHEQAVRLCNAEPRACMRALNALV
jgi:hypothetical protein